MIPTRYLRLDADDPAELAAAGDLDGLLARVVPAMGLSGDVLAEVAADPIRVWVQPSAELNRLARLTGATTCDVRGLCLSSTCVLVLRLDHEGPIAHELVHALQRRLRRPLSCVEAAAVADQVA